jgi:hypothetical protein
MFSFIRYVVILFIEQFCELWLKIKMYLRLKFGNYKRAVKSRYPIMEVSEVTQDIMPIGGQHYRSLFAILERTLVGHTLSSYCWMPV